MLSAPDSAVAISSAKPALPVPALGERALEELGPGGSWRYTASTGSTRPGHLAMWEQIFCSETRNTGAACDLLAVP